MRFIVSHVDHTSSQIVITLWSIDGAVIGPVTINTNDYAYAGKFPLGNVVKLEVTPSSFF